LLAKVKGESSVSALDWNELRSELLAADLGPKLVDELMEQARKIKGDDAQLALTQIITAHLSQRGRTLAEAGAPTVILLVGVNGVGKTTSVAKVAHLLTQQGKSVLLGAADTFRAAAVEQLGIWADRIGCDIVRAQHGTDPASVAHDACEKAKGESFKFTCLQHKSSKILTKTPGATNRMPGEYDSDGRKSCAKRGPIGVLRLEKPSSW
jgi:fused signal recognition particle receptor